MRGSAERLAAALEAHRAALAAFVQRARRVPAAQWEVPRASGKWSPAEITEHLRLSTEKLREEAEGSSSMRLVLPAWKRLLLRLTVLPRILRSGRFPRGAPAPREVRPVSPGLPRDEALGRFEREIARLEAACGATPANGRRLLGHPYFGKISLTRFHRLLAVHALHHREQLPGGP